MNKILLVKVTYFKYLLETPKKVIFESETVIGGNFAFTIPREEIESEYDYAKRFIFCEEIYIPKEGTEEKALIKRAVKTFLDGANIFLSTPYTIDLTVKVSQRLDKISGFPKLEAVPYIKEILS